MQPTDVSAGVCAGAKIVMTVDMVVTAVLCMLIPTAIKTGGPRMMAPMLTLIGLAQGPLIPALQVRALFMTSRRTRARQSLNPSAQTHKMALNASGFSHRRDCDSSPLVGAPTRMERGCQQGDSFADGYRGCRC